MKMETIELRGDQAMRAIFYIDAACCGKLKPSPAVHGFKSKWRALLVEPLNDAPFVLIDDTADPTPGTVSLPAVRRVEFQSEPRSGTDALRARIHATRFFDELPDRPYAVAPAADLVIEPLRLSKTNPGPSQDLVRVILNTRDMCGDEVLAAQEWMQDNDVEWSPERYLAAQMAADEAWRQSQNEAGVARDMSR